MNKLTWCLKQKNGIELAEPNENLCRAYYKEAQETLQQIEGRDTKWEVIMAYYARYNALYSLLMKAGIKCEIHDCALEILKRIDGFSDPDWAFLSMLKEKRIQAQYYLKQERLENLLQVKKFVLKCGNIAENLDIIKLRNQIKNEKNRHMSKKLDIGGLYLHDYHASFNGREIARRIQTSPQTALSSLNALIKEKIFLGITEGRNIKYGLNKEDLRARLFLELCEIEKSSAFLDNFELREIIKTILPYAETVIVFGSFSRGTQKDDSDLDLILVNAQEKVHKLLKIFPREINVQFVKWEDIQKAALKKNHLALEIQKNHLVYGNASEFVETFLNPKL